MRKSIIISGSNSELATGVIFKLKKKYDLIFLYHAKQPKINRIGNIIKIKHSLEDEVDDLHKKIKNKSKNVHGIIHFNAIHNFKTLKSINRNDFNDIFEINCLTFIKLVKLSYYFENIESILAISSVSSKTGNKGISLYSSSKAALNNLIKSASLELAGKNIRVNNIILGHIEKGMGKKTQNYLNEEQLKYLRNSHPLGFGKVEDLFYALDFLLDSKKSRWITGSELVLDGGYLA
jgi:NAD(P)-dependent dehydrogenase (short-subunit alcohol dehydrogenase family)